MRAIMTNEDIHGELRSKWRTIGYDRTRVMYMIVSLDDVINALDVIAKISLTVDNSFRGRSGIDRHKLYN